MAGQATKAAEDAGVRLTVGAARKYDRDGLLDACGFSNASPKAPFARARLVRILEGSGASGEATMAEALKYAAMPGLAREFVNLVVWYKFARHRRSKWNPFLGLSDGDAAKKFSALIFDICDRSTGRMGHWWVK